MNDVKVKIDLAQPIGKLGFGVPLILLENAEKAVEYSEVNGIAELVALGFENTSIVYKAAQLMYAQANAPKTIAVCAYDGAATAALADAKLVAKGWRQLIVVNGDGEKSTVPAISAAVEALEGKMYFASLDVKDSVSITVNGIRRTVLFYCDATENVPVPVAALVGEIAGRDAGSFTYKNLKLKGIETQELTAAEVKAIHQKGGITFIEKAGDAVTSEGKVVGGEYIDVIDSEDYVVQQLTYHTQKVLNNAGKVPYDNNGIAMLEAAAMNVMQDAYNKGMIANKADGTPDYFASYALREDTSETDRSNRHYAGGTFGFALAGAIHEVYITGEITV